MDSTPRIIVTRHARFWWSARVVAGPVEYRRDDGGPYAFTRRRAQVKGRRLHREYTRVTTPEEYEIEPGAAR